MPGPEIIAGLPLPRCRSPLESQGVGFLSSLIALAALPVGMRVTPDYASEELIFENAEFTAFAIPPIADSSVSEISVSSSAYSTRSWPCSLHLKSRLFSHIRLRIPWHIG